MINQRAGSFKRFNKRDKPLEKLHEKKIPINSTRI